MSHAPAHSAWPADSAALMARQRQLAAADPSPWQPGHRVAVGASYCCFAAGPRFAAGQHDGQARGWAAATRKDVGQRAVAATVDGRAHAAYMPGLLALREGPLREAAVWRLDRWPDVLLVDATGRDHPRRAGLALQLGAVLGLATVGVTDRPLVAGGEAPADRRGAHTPLWLDGEIVGRWLRTRAGVKPVAVHAAWRTTPEAAVEVVLAAATRARTPQPLREARRAARAARSLSKG